MLRTSKSESKFLLQYLLYNPDYDLEWDNYIHLDQANHLAWDFQNLISVKEFENSEDSLELTRPYFETAIVADSIKNSLAREYKTSILVFKNPKIDINQKLKPEVERKKNFN